MTGAGALSFVNEELAKYRAAQMVLKNPQDLALSVQQLKDKEAAAQKEIESLRKEKALGAVKDLENSAVDFQGARAIVAKTALDAGSVKDLVFKLKQGPSTLVLIGNVAGGKVTLSIGISDDLVKEKGWHAGNAVRALAQHIQGGGGGAPAFATAGGKNPEGLDKVMAEWQNQFA